MTRRAGVAIVAAALVAGSGHARAAPAPSAYDPAGAAIAVVARALGASVRACAPGVTCVEHSFLVPGGVYAWTVGHTIVARGPVVEPLLAHERVHVAQFERYPLTFALRYAWRSLECLGYECNAYERRARAATAQPRGPATSSAAPASAPDATAPATASMSPANGRSWSSSGDSARTAARAAPVAAAGSAPRRSRP